MTPTALAERYIREACVERPELDRESLAYRALLMSCTDQLANSPSGFDRSATLARAADAKRAEGPAHL